jgi:FAD/FMN-containing dehydrogenase
MAPFLTDWRKMWHGSARAVAQPDTPQDVAHVVRWCAAHGVPIVPQGGNTGLSGGATPDSSGQAIVLSLSRLNRIRAIDPVNGTMIVDAGCVLQAIQAAADEVGMLFPLSLAAEGSCTIGGNLATNAGGTGVLRYGNARGLCLGLEVVTASGELWDGLRGLRKDNTGYDLRDLFIGSEGTLGVITGAVLRLFPRPAGQACAIVAVASVQDAVAVVGAAQTRFDAGLTAAELISETSLCLVLAQSAGARRPLEARAPWYLLLEVSGQDSGDALRAALEGWLLPLLESGRVVDGAIAVSLAQAREFWALREGISEAQAAAGATIKHDVSLPVSAIADFIAEAGPETAARWPGMRAVTFGHVGDGNIHYNFSPAPGVEDADFLAGQDAVNLCVHDIVVRHGGSISAEHGLGALRHVEAARYRPGLETAMMRAVKRALDPGGIMNPGKVLV